MGDWNRKHQRNPRSLGRRVPGRDYGAKAPGKKSTDEPELQEASEGKLRDWVLGEPRTGRVGVYRSLP